MSVHCSQCNFHLLPQVGVSQCHASVTQPALGLRDDVGGGEVVSKYDLFLVKELGHGMSRGVMHLERLRDSLGGSCGEFHGEAFNAK